MTAGRQPVLLVIGQMVCIPQERGGEMKMKRSKMAAFALAAALSVSMAGPAFAAGYEFSGLQPGGNFYQVTEHGQDNEANSGTIIVGADGTIGTDPTAKPRMTPLNGIETPVGEYPDSWGMATDINIAYTSVFPNFFAPPSQWANIKGLVILDPYVVSSGALPTGYQMALGSLYGAPVFIGYMP